MLTKVVYCFSQVPDVVNVDKISGGVGELVTISGNGFSENKSELSVHFGASEGHIVNSTEYLIEVLAPAGSNYNHISVTNLNSHSTGYSASFYNLAFGGSVFEKSRIVESRRIQEDKALFDLCNCDFNGDGLNDVVTTNNTDEATNTSITVYQNTTGANSLDISFQKIFEPNLITSKAARNLTCADLDGDGKPELVVGKGGGNADRIYIFKNQSSTNISFDAPVTVFLSENISSSTTRRLKIHDLDKNGKPDIVMTDQGEGKVFIFENRSTGGSINFPAEFRQSIQTSAGSLVGLDVADITNDGKPEVICNSDKSEVFIIRNESVAGSIDMAIPEQLTITGATLVNTKISDLDNDGDKDIVISNFVNNIFILENEGNENTYSFSAPKYVETNRAPWGLDLGDLNGDGLVDIVVTSTDQADQMTVLINNSSGTGISLVPHNIGNTDISFNINVSDFNGDAKPDIGYTDRKDNQLIFLRNNHCTDANIFPKNPRKICSNEPVKLRSVIAPKANYTWTNTSTSQSVTGNSFFEVSTPGTYMVTIRSNNGSCESSSEAVTITDGGDNLPPTVNVVNPGTVCEGADFKLSAEVISGISYHWTQPDGTKTTGHEVAITNAKIENAGRYALVLESAGCSTDPNFELVEISSIPNMEIASSDGNLFCADQTTTLSAAYVPDGTYKWYKNGNLVPNNETNTLIAETSGDYAVEVENLYHCIQSSSAINIKEVVQPVASFNPVLAGCLGEEINFENTSTFDASEPPIFHWDFGDGVTSSSKDPIHTYASVGDFTVTLSVSYNKAACKNVYEESFAISESKDLKIFVDGSENTNGNFDLCEGKTVVLSVNAPAGQVEWNTGETTAQVDVSEKGTYSVTYLKNSSCSSSDQILVNTVENVSVETTTGNQRIELGRSVQLGAQGADYYLWKPAEDLDDPELPNPLASPIVTTKYSVQGWNSYGCQDSSSVTIFVDEKITAPVDAPRAFTPNGDGQNDEWRIRNIDLFSSCPVRIFNRKGQNVYESNEYKNDWDGTVNGQELPEGAYYYMITCVGDQTYTGDITLIR